MKHQEISWTCDICGKVIDSRPKRPAVELSPSLAGMLNGQFSTGALLSVAVGFPVDIPDRRGDRSYVREFDLCLKHRESIRLALL